MKIFEAPRQPKPPKPPKVTKDQETYGVEKRVLDHLASRLQSYELTAFIGSEREDGCTKLKVSIPGSSAIVTATAGTEYKAQTGEKHHQVDIELIITEPVMKVTVDAYDDAEVRNGTSIVARALATAFKKQYDETGGDARKVVKELEDAGFGAPVHFETEDAGPGWVRSKFDLMLRASIEVAAEDKVRIRIYYKSGNKREIIIGSRVVQLPRENTADFVWDQFREMAKGIRRAYPGRNASAAFDKLTKTVAEAIAEAFGGNNGH